jgi:hypothetical protein
MRHVAVAVALTLVGCAPPAPPPARGAPVVGHAPLDRLVDEPAHGPPTALAAPSRGAAEHGADQVAMRLILEGLEAQGLDVVDLGVQQTTRRAGAATVVVAATHAASSGATHMSIYQLDLVRTGRGWQLQSFRPVQ